MKKKNFLIIVFCILGFCSCKKNQNPVANPKVDVYVAGQVGGLAAYWKNDSLIYLTGGTIANSIVVSGNDVYVAGIGGGQARYWKNGVEGQALNHGRLPTGAKSIAVSGNDVYVAGYGLVFNPYGAYHSKEIFWKNDSIVDALLYSHSSYLTSILISGNDIYLVGGGGGDAMYYKNGNPVVLSAGDASTYNYTSSIAISGNDLYVAGTEEISVNQYSTIGVAKYWKNGNPINLTSVSTEDATASSIAVSGNNVYVAGIQYDRLSTNGIAKYWKNGIPVKLTDGSTDDQANSIAVSGTDVYVAGTANGIATYWKNGKAVNLSNIPSAANSIFLSKQ
jgi:hypothetical protein